MILAMENLSKSYAANVVLKDITLKIEDNDRIGLIGVNGAGKSTLLKIITGVEQHDEGTLSVSNHAKIGFLQQNSGLSSASTIMDEMRKVFEKTIETEREMRNTENEMANTDPSSQKYAELSVEYACSIRIAVNIVSVTVHHVKIDQIYKTESFKIPVKQFYRLFHAVNVVLCLDCVSNSAPCKDVAYLSD